MYSGIPVHIQIYMQICTCKHTYRFISHNLQIINKVYLYMVILNIHIDYGDIHVFHLYVSDVAWTCILAKI